MNTPAQQAAGHAPSAGAPASAARPHFAQATPPQAWATTPVRARLRVLRQIRHALAERADEFTGSIAPELARNRADTLAAEVLPLLAAAKFLEHEGPRLLAPRRLGRRGLPFWLAGIDATVERVPCGTILVIAPANYPLFLPGVQALQALAAGNAVVWKPGRGGLAPAQVFADACTAAGLPQGLLRLTDESVESATAEIGKRPDKIIFTGSAAAGRAIQHLAADLAIPVIAELSGSDAVFVLPGAKAEDLIAALCFGMRLNGSATCMAPRRLILIGPRSRYDALLTELEQRFAAMDPIFVPRPLHQHLEALLADAAQHGADVRGQLGEAAMKPMLLLNGNSEMKLASTDLFAPVLTVLHAEDTAAALALEAASPFGLTAAIFGSEPEARTLAGELKVGNILINDLIVPTADPRISFGGRKASGFGSTRGAEGLLEMTAVRTLSIRRGNNYRHLAPTTAAHEQLFSGVAALTHQAGWPARLAGIQNIVQAVRKLK